MKPFSQACANNQQPILDILKIEFAKCRSIVEIGSGTGQHAVFFATHMRHLQWQTSDLAHNHHGINAWLADYDGKNLHAPLALDVNDPQWLLAQVDGSFTANTLHIMSWSEVERLFNHLKRLVVTGGKLIIYGPFKYDGQFTSESNERFNHFLQAEVSHRGIRDFEAVVSLASAADFQFEQDIQMPANNQLLVFNKR